MFGGICYVLAFCERRRAIAVNTGNIIECKIDVHNFRCKILRGYERRNDHSRAFGRADDVEEGAEFLCMSFSFVVIETVRVTPYWNETQFPPLLRVAPNPISTYRKVTIMDLMCFFQLLHEPWGREDTNALAIVFNFAQNIRILFRYQVCLFHLLLNWC